jgi:hypothetical protein
VFIEILRPFSPWRRKPPSQVFLFYHQSIFIWTLKTKSLLPSLYKREELPLFGKEGRGEIS